MPAPSAALAEEETLAALARFMRGRRKQLASHDLFAFAELLEGICGAETFPAVREKLFPPEAMRDLAELKEHFHDHIAHTHARRSTRGSASGGATARTTSSSVASA